MRDTEVLVRFLPSDREVYVLPGTRLIEAAADAGIVVEVPCGGEGICGKCRVIVRTGAAEPTTVERSTFSAEELQVGWRLACQTAINESAEIEIPPASRVAAEHKILVQAEQTSVAPKDPPVSKHFVQMTPPSRGDDAADLLRLEQAIGRGPIKTDLPLLRTLAAQLRENDFQGTAVLTDHRLLDIEIGNTENDAFAVAIDIGTTTLVASLLDLGTGSEWAVVSRLNPQTRYGDDVLSRILHVRQDGEGLRQLHESICSAIDEMIGELCQKAGIPRQRIYEISFAGNTTMQQLLCGIDVSPLGETPFVPAAGRSLTFSAVELGLYIHPRGSCHVQPVIGGFVGGDTVAGILATGLADRDGASLLVDIGTNGEIVLRANGRMSAASTAAGPAFEGARISCGMRGCTGAIEKVVVDGRLRINVIGNAAPIGLCGSGLIDLAAELLRHGILTPQGRLLPREQLPSDAHPDLISRVLQENGKTAFLLASEEESGTGQPITITQRDLRELQLATGAIRAGIIILLRQMGLQPKDLDRVLIGGGFGNFIRRNNAQRIGLLPSEVEHSRIRYMGNTSLAGARLTALSIGARQAVDELARQARHVDLSTDRDFQQAFADAMLFPEA